MNLNMNPAVGDSYSSISQRTRAITEDWAAKNLFCVACSSSSMSVEPNNTRVKDFTCPECESAYQLKATGRRFGRTVSNSAYSSKIDAIEAGRVPNYTFLQFSNHDWRITDLFVVPGHFFTRSVIHQRNPLRSSARRRGWVGSNIILGEIPKEGRIQLVSESEVIDPAVVRRQWNKVAFLATDPRASQGWGADVFVRVKLLANELNNAEFTLQEFNIRFLDELSVLHPDNQHMAAKIRQQLQVLRDGGLLKFVNNRGQYRLLA
jgi:type II restriction enzyme